jgi:hypothetical protein
MSWPTAGLAVGLALSSPIAGFIVDGNPASSAYWVSAACAIGAAVTGLALVGSLRRANRAATARIAAGTQAAPAVEPAA